MRSLGTATKSSPCLLQLEKARTQQQRPNTAKNKINKFFWKSFKKKKRIWFKKECLRVFVTMCPLGLCSVQPAQPFLMTLLQNKVSVLQHRHSSPSSSFFFFFNKFIYFIYFIFGCVGSSLLCAGFLYLLRTGATLRWGAWASHPGGFSCCRARALGARASAVVARGLQSTGSVVVAHGLNCFTACGIFPNQGSNPCPLHWQEDS